MVSARRRPIDQNLDVLIAEDSPTQAHRLQHMLMEHGYEVRHAANGQLALDAARRRKPALIISDVIMPEMDGYELCRQVKADATLGDVPVILVTTLSDPGDVIRGLECRADNFILKPFEEGYLLSRVQFVLMNRAMRQTEQGGLAVEIFFNGQQHTITADRLQILNLLLSTYDAAIQRNKELTRAKEDLAERGSALIQRERQLSDAKAFLERLLAASPAVIARFELEADEIRLVYVSPNIERVFGYVVEEVVGAPNFWMEIVHPDDREVLRLALRSVLKGAAAQQIEHEYRCLAKNGDYRWVVTTISVEFGEREGRPTGILTHVLDITARKRAEQGVRRAESFLDSIVENAPNIIFVKDARDLRFVRLNRAFENLFGHARSEMLGKTDYDFFTAKEADFFTANDRAALEGQTLIDIPEERVATATRGVRVLHTRKLPILGPDGLPQYLLGIAEDITERTVAEHALAAAKEEAERANLAKSQFLSRMSHELRTPLNAILGFAQLLELAGLDADGQESVGQILKGGQHLLELINEVLDIARIEAGHLSLSSEPVNAVEVVEALIELVRPLAVARQVTLRIDAPADDAVILADRQRLKQIVLNLLSNAVKYNRPGGLATVGFERVASQRLRITVTDTGRGIPPAKRALLFQPFERLGAEQVGVEGTGLGLALSRALAEAMGGTLDVESEVDRGTTFWVELPRTDPASPRVAATPDAAVAAADRADTAGLVLYIEDNRSNVRLMERVLQRRPGVRLLHAPTGADGLRLALDERPQLILLDLHLPDMTGQDVLHRLWQDPDLRRIPVAILSADAMPGHIRHLEASGAVAYLTKPIEIRRVLQVIDERLAGTPGADRLPEG